MNAALNYRYLIAGAVGLAVMFWLAANQPKVVKGPEITVSERRTDFAFDFSPLERQLEMEAPFTTGTSPLPAIEDALHEAALAVIDRTATANIRTADAALWNSGKEKLLLEEVAARLQKLDFGPGPAMLFHDGTKVHDELHVALWLHVGWRLDLDIRAHLGEPMTLSYGPPKDAKGDRIVFDPNELDAPWSARKLGELATSDDVLDRITWSVASAALAQHPDEARALMEPRVSNSRDVPLRVLEMRASRLAGDDDSALRTAQELYAEETEVLDTFHAEVLYTRALLAPAYDLEHYDAVLAPLAAFEDATDTDPTRRVFAHTRSAENLTLGGRGDDAAHHAGVADANAERADPEPLRRLAADEVYEAFAADCSAARVLADASEALYAGEDACAESCRACEQACVDPCLSCGGDELCTRVRVACSNACVDADAACRSD